MRPAERAARAAAYERARPEILEHVPAHRPTRARPRLRDRHDRRGAQERQAAEVVGIELEPEYAREAATRLDHVITGDAAHRRARAAASTC